MAQPSVAREPSMEEILASIRRIIESNDPGLGREPGQAMSPIYAGDDDIGDVETEMTLDEARELSLILEAANDKTAPSSVAADMRMSAPIAAPSPEPVMAREQENQVAQAPKSISLADLAARVRAAADRSEDGMIRSVAQNGTPQQGSPVSDSPVMTGRMAEMRNPALTRMAEPPADTMPVQRPPMTAPVAAAQVREPDYRAVGAEMQAALDSAMRQSPASQPVEVDSAVSAAPLADDGRGLISLGAGQQIARSFEELAAAIDGNQRRSLDEMAEEMLRPMLQEWLDDNLPTLVERLVREEIERVARGPRR